MLPKSVEWLNNFKLVRLIGILTGRATLLILMKEG